MADNMGIPPPPTGYVLQSSAPISGGAGAMPPPPAGYVLQGGGSASQPDSGQLSSKYYAAAAAGDEAGKLDAFRAIRASGGRLAPPNQQQISQITQSQHNPTDGMSTTDKFLSGAGKSFVDTYRGLQQVGAGIVSVLPGSVGSYGSRQSDRLKQEQADVQQRDAPLMATGAGMVGNVVGQGAQMALPVGDLAAAGKGAQFLKAGLTAGAFSGAQPVTQGESRLVNAGEGAAAGVAGHGVTAGLGALAKATKPWLSDATQKGIQTLRDAGVPLHFSQLTDSKAAKVVASAASYLPFSGSGSAGKAQQEGFNRALSKTVGQDASSLTPDVMKKASTAIGNQYNNLFARNTVNIAPEDVSKLVSLAKQAVTDLPPDQAKIIHNQIAKFVNAAGDHDGQIPGRLYQNIRATLIPMEKNQPTGHLVGKVRKAMQDAASSSFGAKDAQELARLNGQYSNLKILSKALTRADGADNNVNPARLWSLVNSKYGSTDEMRALAQAGQLVLKDPIPDSGTAARNVVYGLMGAGGALHPAGIPSLAGTAAMGATVGRALNSQAAAKLLPGITSKTLGGLTGLSRPARVLAPAVVSAKKQK